MSLENAKRRRLLMERGFLEKAERSSKKLKAALGKATVILYGSVAKGDFNRASDVDLIVVSNTLPKKFIDRLGLLFSFSEPGVEPKGYTQKEFLALSEKANFRKMLLHKKILVDDLGLF